MSFFIGSCKFLVLFILALVFVLFSLLASWHAYRIIKFEKSHASGYEGASLTCDKIANTLLYCDVMLHETKVLGSVLTLTDLGI